MLPPPHTPLVDEDSAADACLATLKSPKSTVLPSSPIVTYSMVLTVVALLNNPREYSALVLSPQALFEFLPAVLSVSPKSAASPVDAIVMKFILL